MDTNKDSHTWFEKVEFLTEALPYMHQYNGSSIVIKFGGHAMTDNKVLSSFAKDIAILQQVGIKPVVIITASSPLLIK